MAFAVGFNGQLQSSYEMSVNGWYMRSIQFWLAEITTAMSDKTVKVFHASISRISIIHLEIFMIFLSQKEITISTVQMETWEEW